MSSRGSHDSAIAGQMASSNRSWPSERLCCRTRWRATGNPNVFTYLGDSLEFQNGSEGVVAALRLRMRLRRRGGGSENSAKARDRCTGAAKRATASVKSVRGGVGGFTGPIIGLPVRRDKAPFLSGCESRPLGNCLHPPDHVWEARLSLPQRPGGASRPLPPLDAQGARKDRRLEAHRRRTRPVSGMDREQP